MTDVTSPASSTVPNAARADHAQRGRRRRRLQEAGRPGFLWALPAVAYFAVFALLPLAFAIYLSFTDYNGIHLTEPKLVGLENWIRLVSDPVLLRSVTTTITLIVLALATQVPVSMLIGVWASGPQRGRGIVVAIYFIPLLMSTAAVATLWSSLLDPNFGLPAALPWLFGDGNLIGNRGTALGVVAFIYLWGASPLHTMIYQAGARAIPRALYEAAQIDGAGRVGQFFGITLPMLRNTIITSTILMIVGTFTTFDLILILTHGGPARATSILPYTMYEEAFTSFDFGYGSAIAVVLITLAALTSVVLVRVTGYDKMQGVQEGI